MARKSRQKRGRPEFKPTKDQRREVSIAAGGGMPHEEIALGLGISRNTLEKHFEHELSIGSAEKRLEVLQALHRAAKQGKVAAIKEYLSSSPQLAAPPAPKDKPKGKKEVAQAEAVGAQTGTEWHEDLPRHGQQTKH